MGQAEEHVGAGVGDRRAVKRHVLELGEWLEMLAGRVAELGFGDPEGLELLEVSNVAQPVSEMPAAPERRR